MKLKGFFAVLAVLAACSQSSGQVGTMPALGMSVIAMPVVGKAGTLGKSSLPVCSPANYNCGTTASRTYTFTGDGNWDVQENWENNAVPPPFLPAGYQVLVAPEGGLGCILNVWQTIGSGATITVEAGKRFLVPGSVKGD